MALIARVGTSPTRTARRRGSRAAPPAGRVALRPATTRADEVASGGVAPSVAGERAPLADRALSASDQRVRVRVCAFDCRMQYSPLDCASRSLGGMQWWHATGVTIGHLFGEDHIEMARAHPFDDVLSTTGHEKADVHTCGPNFPPSAWPFSLLPRAPSPQPTALHYRRTSTCIPKWPTPLFVAPTATSARLPRSPRCLSRRLRGGLRYKATEQPRVDASESTRGAVRRAGSGLSG